MHPHDVFYVCVYKFVWQYHNADRTWPPMVWLKIAKGEKYLLDPKLPKSNFDLLR